MNEISNDSFEAFKERYYNFLVSTFQRNQAIARDKDFSKKVQEVLHSIFSDETLDEFSQSVAESFNVQYKLGFEIKEIIKNLKEIQRQYLQNQDPTAIGSIKHEYVRFLGFKTSNLKSTTHFNEKGEEVSKFEYEYNFTFKNLRKLIKAKTDQEKFDIYTNEMRVRKQTKAQEIKCVTQIIDPNEQNDWKWLKALVKYQSRKEFSAYLENQNKESKTPTSAKDKSKPDKMKQVVKWTNGNKSNDFVKLVYTLFEAKLINNGTGEITKIVESLAPVFGIDLKDWQSNFSKGIHEQKLDYNHGAFFEKLTETYVNYQKEKAKNKKK